ncbi:hypothetical protein J6T21_00925 [Candidatus Saccharibacteria bacterium]|nr:hypothetical protein [Candidatus Saccharibacteria bacterium]
MYHDPMDYGKARGMKLLERYLPDAVPFSDLRVIENYDEWKEVKDSYGSFIFQRVDLPIGNTKYPISNTNGYSHDVSRVLNEAKMQNPDSVLLVMKTKKPTCVRYLYDGGLNVLFVPDDLIIIELVGRGFDGHELTRDLAVHERYFVSWSDIPLVDGTVRSLAKTSFKKYYVSPHQYARQHWERINFLVNECKYEMTEVNRNIPVEPERLHDALIESLFNDVILPIFKRKADLLRNDFTQFCIQGNFVNGKAQPWEMTVDKRWL